MNLKPYLDYTGTLEYCAQEGGFAEPCLLTSLPDQEWEPRQPFDERYRPTLSLESLIHDAFGNGSMDDQSYGKVRVTVEVVE